MGSRKLWLIVLAVWFALWGLLQVSNVRFEAQGVVMGILALAVAVLVAFDQ